MLELASPLPVLEQHLIPPCAGTGLTPPCAGVGLTLPVWEPRLTPPCAGAAPHLSLCWSWPHPFLWRTWPHPSLCGSRTSSLPVQELASPLLVQDLCSLRSSLLSDPQPLNSWPLGASSQDSLALGCPPLTPISPVPPDCPTGNTQDPSGASWLHLCRHVLGAQQMCVGDWVDPVCLQRPRARPGRLIQAIVTLASRDGWDFSPGRLLPIRVCFPCPLVGGAKPHHAAPSFSPSHFAPPPSPTLLGSLSLRWSL